MAKSLELAKLFVTLEAETKGLSGQLEGAERSLGRTASFIKANPVAAMGALAAAAVAVGVAATKMAAEMDDALKKVTARIPGTVKDIDRLRNTANDLAVEFGFTQSEVVGAMQAIADAGVESQEDLEVATKAIAAAARASGEDFNALVGGLDAALDIFGIAAKDSEAVLAKLFVTAQGKTTIEELGGTLEKLAPTIQGTGIDFNTATEALGALIGSGFAPGKPAIAQFAKVLKDEGVAGIQRLAASSGVATDGIKEFRAAIQTNSESVGVLGQKLKSSVVEIMVNLGSKILPVVVKGFEVLARVVNVLTGNTKSSLQSTDEYAESVKRLSVASGTAAVGVSGLTAEQQKAADEAEKAAQKRIKALEREDAAEEKAAAKKRAREEAIQNIVSTTLAISAAKIATIIEENTQVEKLLPNYKGLEAVIKRIGDADEEREATLKKQKEHQAAIARDIETAARGLVGVGQAAGIWSDETAATLQNLVTIGSQINTILTADNLSTGSIVGLVGSLVGVLGGLFGGSPEENARRRIIQENTQRLKELAEINGDLVEASSSGKAIAGVGAAIGRGFRLSGSSVSKGVLNDQDTAALASNLADQGLTLADLDRVAKDLGITVRDKDGRIVTRSLPQLLDAINKLDTGSSKTFSGRLNTIDTGLQIGTVKPGEEFGALVNAAGADNAISKLLGGIDLTSAAGRGQAKTGLQGLFGDLASGKLSLSDLGGLSRREFEGLIVRLIGILSGDQEITPFSIGSGGGGNDVPSLSVAVDDGFAGLSENQSTANDLLAGILDTLRSFSPLAAPNLAAASGSGGGSVQLGGLTITINAAPGQSEQSIAQLTLDAINQYLGGGLQRARADAGSAVRI